jgi:enediyne biosynthesis thioesterase
LEIAMSGSLQSAASGLDAGLARPGYRYRHIVSFQDTNVVGNVYFACHVAWQGRCRELFLKEHAPEVLAELTRDLRLVTLNVRCEYFAEILVADEVEIYMSLAHLRQNRIGLSFEYTVHRETAPTPVARGFQEVGCMRVVGDSLLPVAPPLALERAFARLSVRTPP